MPSRLVSGPILRMRRSWSRKSSSVNWFLRSFCSSALASSSSTERSAFSMKRQHVAHAEDPLGHAVRVEALEVRQLLAGGGEHDRLAGDRLDRQRGAAARVAVELGEHDAVELGGLGELLGDVDGVLAGHRVDDQQHDVRLDRLLDVGQLLHQLLVDVQAARGVDDQHVLAVALGLVERPARDVDRVAVGALLVDGRAGLGADLDELLDRGRPVDVAGRDARPRSRAPRAGSARAWPWRSSCPSPAGRPSGSPSAAAARTSAPPRRRPSAR